MRPFVELSFMPPALASGSTTFDYRANVTPPRDPDRWGTLVEAIKDVDADLRVGGPATAKNEWIEEFLEFCERNDLPADFVSTHQYPTDAFGSEGDDTEDAYALWTFTDIFEEEYFPSVPFHGGFGLLNLHGIPNRGGALR